jgi:hypothetical protein
MKSAKSTGYPHRQPIFLHQIRLLLLVVVVFVLYLIHLILNYFHPRLFFKLYLIIHLIYFKLCLIIHFFKKLSHILL